MNIKMWLIPCILIALSVYTMDENNDLNKFDLTQPPNSVTKQQLTYRLPPNQPEDECNNCLYTLYWVAAIFLGQEPTKQE